MDCTANGGPTKFSPKSKSYFLIQEIVLGAHGGDHPGRVVGSVDTKNLIQHLYFFEEVRRSDRKLFGRPFFWVSY